LRFRNVVREAILQLIVQQALTDPQNANNQQARGGNKHAQLGCLEHHAYNHLTSG
jgi:hypothetical protein